MCAAAFGGRLRRTSGLTCHSSRSRKTAAAPQALPWSCSIGSSREQPTRPEAEPAQILRALYSQSAHGIYASAMMRYFQQNGFRAFAFAGNGIDLERELHYGRPLIVALKPDSGPLASLRRCRGARRAAALVIVNDPAQRKLLKEDQSEFEREWKAAGNWTLLAVPETSEN